jgi:DNA-binding transcriptional ArsR family regulator
MSRSTPNNAAAARRRTAPIFAALGDETRLALVSSLASGESRSIAQLTEGTALTRQAVTKHLRALEGARIVRSARAGRETLFTLDPEPLREARDYADAAAAQWDHALARLKAFVEREP